MIIAEYQKECIFLDCTYLEMRIGNVEQYRKFHVNFLDHTVKIQDEHLQKTRTRELYSREHLSDDGHVTSGGGPDGEHRRIWLKFRCTHVVWRARLGCGLIWWVTRMEHRAPGEQCGEC